MDSVKSQNKKLGFWQLFFIVTGSQIGAGVFMLPSSIAPYGIYGILGWFTSSLGALLLAFIFAKLSTIYKVTGGGPHVFIREIFGYKLAYIAGWTYWIISWVGTTAITITSAGYLLEVFGSSSKILLIIFETILLLIVTIINLRGIQTASKIEFFLAILKFIPLVILPLLGLSYFDINNISIDNNLLNNNSDSFHLLGRVTLLTLWGFIGLESGITPAAHVEKPNINIPLAIILGTLVVTIIYIFNSIGIMGLIPAKILANSQAPYSSAAEIIFGGKIYFISLLAFIVCACNLNAWTLNVGQISSCLAKDSIMPNIFAKSNKYGAPITGILASSIGIFLLLIFSNQKSFTNQVTDIIDVSVTCYIFVYLIISIGFTYIMLISHRNYFYSLIGLICNLFLFWIIYETPLNTIFQASIFSFISVPIYFIMNKNKIKENAR